MYFKHQMPAPKKQIALKHILLIVQFLFATCQINGQLIFRDTDKKTSELEIQQMHAAYLDIRDSLVGNYFDYYAAHLLEVSGKYYMIPEGHFNVYLWENGGWKNQYKGIFFGYNFRSTKFVLNGNIYSFGGYGYWKSHGQVIRFIPDKGEWELIKFAEGLNNSHAYCTEKGLFIVSDTCKVIDFTSKTISIFEDHPYDLRYNEKQITPTLELDSFYYIASKPQFIINKYTHEAYTTDVNPFKSLLYSFYNNHDMVWMYHDTIVRIFNDGRDRDTFDITNELEFFIPYAKKTNQISYAWFTLLLLIPIVLWWFLAKSTYQKKYTLHKVSWDNIYINPLLTCTNQTISAEKLDEILGITDIKPSETQRYRRAQLIKEINQEFNTKAGGDLIVRINDPLDGRRYNYRIG